MFGLELAGVAGTSVPLRVDILDGGPVLDIRPSVPHFDVWKAGRAGWCDRKAENAGAARSDGRFREL